MEDVDPELTPPGPRGPDSAIVRVLKGAAHLAGRSWKWLKWPVGLGILWWLFHSNRKALEHVYHSPKNWWWLALAAVLILGSTLLTFLRWYLLVRAQDFPFRFRDAVRYGFVGLVANYVAPGSVGGDLFKAVLLARDHRSRKTAAVGTVVLDRILGLLALFIVGVTASLLPHDFPDNPQVETNTIILYVATTTGFAGLLFLLIPGTTRWSWIQKLPKLPLVGHIVGELIHSVQLYQTRPAAVFKALGLSLLGHAGLITGFYCCALAIQQPWIPDLMAHLYFMPNAELFGAASAIPGGVGALEWAIQQAYFWLSPPDVTEDQAKGAGLAAALVFRVIQFAISAVGFVYYLASRREMSQAIEEAAHLEEPATT